MRDPPCLGNVLLRDASSSGCGVEWNEMKRTKVATMENGSQQRANKLIAPGSARSRASFLSAEYASRQSVASGGKSQGMRKKKCRYTVFPVLGASRTQPSRGIRTCVASLSSPYHTSPAPPCPSMTLVGGRNAASERERRKKKRPSQGISDGERGIFPARHASDDPA